MCLDYLLCRIGVDIEETTDDAALVPTADVVQACSVALRGEVAEYHLHTLSDTILIDVDKAWKTIKTICN